MGSPKKVQTKKQHKVEYYNRTLFFDIDDIKGKVFVDIILTFEDRPQEWFLSLIDYDTFKNEEMFSVFVKEEFNKDYF